MATIDLGKIAITPEGKWSAGKYYEKLSLVIFNGQSYLSLRDTTGDNPETSRSDWMQITSRGESLYQMMVREGKFVGTEEEFLQQYLDSLKACADASEEVRAALSDILNEMDRVRAEISEVMVEEDIRIKNEAKREAAEINRRNAEITRGVEERNRQEAEQRREQSMQQIQNDAEIALAMAAEAQQKAEEAILNEEERVRAENQRKIDEATRIQHEEQRVNDEAMRRSREADRQESENIRQKNEGDRILAEREREEIMRNLVEELKRLAANRFKIVDVLPEVGEFAVIYLVPSTMPSDNDVYDEWAYVSEKWEHIGSTRFKIDNYFTKEEVERLLVTKQDTLTAGNGISIEGNKIGVTAITESESQPHTSLWVNPSEDEETDVTYNRSQIDAMVGAKQDALQLTVKDNGNIVLSNIQGQSKEFMPATPSGDPMHYAYEAAGAEWNGTGADIVKTAPWADLADDDADKTVIHKAGYWYLNGLGDITNEQMRVIFIETNNFLGSVQSTAEGFYAESKFRVNLSPSEYKITLSRLRTDYLDTFRNIEYLEAIVFPEFNKGNSPNWCFRPRSIQSMFYNSIRLKFISGLMNLGGCTNAANVFTNCRGLRIVKLYAIKLGIDISNSPKLTAKSILYMIRNEAATSAITITLHADAYARAMANADIVAALEAHPNVSLASA